MDCSCVSVGVDEYAQVLFQKLRKARKNHKCCECRREILSGEQYEIYKGVYEGEIFSQKTCLDCLSIRTAFFCDWHWEQLWDDMYEHVSDCAGELSEKLLSELTPKARAKVCAAIEDQWEYEEE